MIRRVIHYEKRDIRGALRAPFTAAVISDLHNAAFDDILPEISRVDAILVPGDLLNRHEDRWDHVIEFLDAAPTLAPTFFSTGNHDRLSVNAEAFRRKLRGSGVVCVDHRMVRLRKDLVIGGIPSQLQISRSTGRLLQRFSQAGGFRLLLCHHPEYYPRLIQGRGIDLTVSGHAHGGQIQCFGRGLYAPGQGLFPRLTNGFYDHDSLLVSRGMTNNIMAPRLNNPCELLMLHLLPAETDAARRQS